MGAKREPSRQFLKAVSRASGSPSSAQFAAPVPLFEPRAVTSHEPVSGLRFAVGADAVRRVDLTEALGRWWGWCNWVRCRLGRVGPSCRLAGR